MRPVSRGSILILALWTLMVLGFLALAVGGHVSANIRMARYLQDDATAYSQARSGVALAVSEVLHHPEKFVLSESGIPQDWPDLFKDNASLPGGSFSVSSTYAYLNTNEEDMLVIVTNFGLVPERVKINLDDQGMAGSSQRLAMVLGDVQLATAILTDYPSNKYDDVVGGAPESEFAVAQKWWSRYGPYEAVPELLAVKGVTGEQFDTLEPLVSIWELQRWWLDDQRITWESFGGIAEGRAWVTGPEGLPTTVATRRISFVFGFCSNSVTQTSTNMMLYWREH
ncbi:MAG: general secretion pathway protein GspK [Lentisphaerae bacterium]|nr:general secretion pathway protein GspK [Lentisphaerota bacterium]